MQASRKGLTGVWIGGLLATWLPLMAAAAQSPAAPPSGPKVDPQAAVSSATATDTKAADGSDPGNPSAPAPQLNLDAPPPASRVDLYGGYAFLMPSGSIGGTSYENINEGAVTSATLFFSKHVGAQIEGGLHPNGPNDCFFSAQGGVVYRFFKGERFVPFAHALGGGAKVGGPQFQPCTWGYGVTTGLGFDYILPRFNEHLALRLLQADYEYMHVNYGPPGQYNLTGGTASVNALRLSAGLVLRLGEENPKLQKTLFCDANPTEVYSGEKATIAANTRNYSPNTQYSYRWDLSGGKVEGYGPIVFVNTAGLAAGTYTATAHVSKTPKSKQLAQCSASLIVKQSPAPTIKCSANPNTVNPGEPSTITSYAASIAQRKLTYSYSASAGQIGGTSAAAQLTTAGVAPGTIAVTCRVQDDLGQTAQATTEVTVLAPPLPPAPAAQPLCTLTFNRDPRRPARVDNEGRACLDDIALTMQHQPDARLVVIGDHAISEEDGQIVAAERAVNTRAYLSTEKGIDPARVDIRTGSSAGRQVETYLLVPGAVFDQPTENRIDESKVKVRRGQQYAPGSRPRHRGPDGPVGEGISRPPKR